MRRMSSSLLSCGPPSLAHVPALTEIERYRISKSSKRASLIICDVSKSFVDTFAGPAQQPVRPGKPVLKSIVPTSTPTAQKSLLDDDDNDNDGFGPLMSAAPAEGDRLGQALVPSPASAVTSMVSRKSKKTAEDDGDENWNWE